MDRTKTISKRLLEMVDALPLFPGARVLEIGCGPGAAAREIANRIGDGYILAIDRSAKAIAQAIAGSKKAIESGRLEFLQVAAEDFELPRGSKKFDLVFAVRVGALDGRHPELGKQVMEKLAKVLKPKGKLFVDGVPTSSLSETP